MWTFRSPLLRSPFLIASLLVLASPLSAQTIYRTVGANGKITFSDTPPAGNDNRDIRRYSSNALSQSNSLGQPEPGAHSRFYNQCRPDWQRFCISSTSENQALQCLLDHQQQVSDRCYDAMKQQMGSTNNAGNTSGNPGTTGNRDNRRNEQGGNNPLQSCQQDSQRFCQGIQPGGGRLINCLLDHQQEISDACYSTLEKQARRKQGSK